MRLWLRRNVVDLSREQRDAAILILYYGLDEDERGWSYSEIGELLDVKKARVHQLRDQALERIVRHEDFAEFQDELKRQPLSELPPKWRDLIETMAAKETTYRN